MAMYLASEKKKKQGTILQKKKGEYDPLNEQEVIAAQTRALIIELGKSVLNLRCFNLNEKILNVLIQVRNQFDKI